MNALLPKDIRIMYIRKAKEDFHSRYSAIFRDYTYFIYNKTTLNPFFMRYSWHVPYFLDIDLMKDKKQMFIGNRDFGFISNEPNDKNCVRDVHFLRIKRKGDFIVIHIRANGFLRGMVRNIVGYLVALSRNTLKMDTSKNIIQKQVEIKSFKAPPNGLFLSRVFYVRSDV